MQQSAGTPRWNSSPRRDSSLREYLIAAEAAQASGLNGAAGFSVVRTRGEKHHAQPALEENISENFD